MHQGIECEPPLAARRRVTQAVSRDRMAEFVDADAHDQDDQIENEGEDACRVNQLDACRLPRCWDYSIVWVYYAHP